MEKKESKSMEVLSFNVVCSIMIVKIVKLIKTFSHIILTSINTTHTITLVKLNPLNCSVQVHCNIIVSLDEDNETIAGLLLLLLEVSTTPISY